MGKFTNINNLAEKDQVELFIIFAQALASLRSSVEAASFIKDILSEQEALMLARRLQIAELLNEGWSYEQIHAFNKASSNTIARVQTWLRIYGDGYRAVINRIKSKSGGVKNLELSSWAQHKKKYPMYYWPELLLKEIVRSANSKEKQRLRATLKQLKEKSKLNETLLKLLR